MTSLLNKGTDKHTYSNFEEIKVHNHSIEWTVDFENQKLVGSVVYTIEKIGENPDDVNTFVLDARNLNIFKVSCDEHQLKYVTMNPKEDIPTVFGTPIIIYLPTNNDEYGEEYEGKRKLEIKIEYETKKEGECIQWMTKAQTVGKKHPYLYTQGQAIHARSLLPCQDAPQCKTSYDATVHVSDKELVAVMSAVKQSREPALTQKFVQKIPISSYLIAIAVGNLASKRIGPRSHVWTEPQQIEEVAYEFGETEKFIAAAEEFLPQYQWGEYDVLLLPPSFPYGGMENPCLTFATSTLIAGDRSLSGVIAHEIAHSWSGNLVTNLNWEHFWLNEGFTVYIERRIKARLYGQPYADFDAILQKNHLDDDIEFFTETQKLPHLTKLRPDLTLVDPDDSFSSVPYEKGFNFLYYITSLVGGFEAFEKFLYSYFNKFASKTVSTTQFKEEICNFFPDLEAKIDWDSWFFSEGSLPVENSFDRSIPQEIEKQIETISIDSLPDMCEWKAININYFLDLLVKKDVSKELLDAMKEKYNFSNIQNAEIRFRWIMLGLANEYEEVYEDAITMATSQGRMKFVRPLYRALYKTSNGKQMAKDAFKKHREFYHPICLKVVDRDFAKADENASGDVTATKKGESCCCSMNHKACIMIGAAATVILGTFLYKRFYKK
mmetsp:Transcript_51/g.91  ORF Transcript_51/g.91 Transcript_51/m.91 type:complete len:663 (-) Transcript_51:3241-5229(-)